MRCDNFRIFVLDMLPPVKIQQYGYTYGDNIVYWSMRFYVETWHVPMSLNLPKE